MEMCSGDLISRKLDWAGTFSEGISESHYADCSVATVHVKLTLKEEGTPTLSH